MVPLHTPEQQEAPASAPQLSPEARHAVVESSAQDPLSQDDEQHSSSIMQLVPDTLQVAPPQVPPWQSSEQQAWWVSHRDPSAAQYPRHSRLPPCGSQRPLQHLLRVAHELPGDMHAPDGRQ